VTNGRAAKAAHAGEHATHGWKCER
jgi:hypothetical protein